MRSGAAGDRQGGPVRQAVAAVRPPLLAWTRPQPAAAALRAALEAGGVELLSLALIGTRVAPASQRLDAALQHAAAAARRIYVSAAAVAAVARRAPALLQLPAAAVGPQTAAALRAAGCTELWTADGELGAEALLALPQWRQLAGQRVAVLHARGGHQAPFAALDACGVAVDWLAVYQRYRRRVPEASRRSLRTELARLVWLAPSVAVLQTLDALLRADPFPDEAWQRPVLALSPRIAAAAGALGFSQVRLCPDLQAATLLRSLGGETGVVRQDDHD